MPDMDRISPLPPFWSKNTLLSPRCDSFRGILRSPEEDPKLFLGRAARRPGAPSGISQIGADFWKLLPAGRKLSPSSRSGLSSIPTDTNRYAIFRKSLLSDSIQFIRLRTRKTKYWCWMESAGTGPANALFGGGSLMGYLLFPGASWGRRQDVLLFIGGLAMRRKINPCLERAETVAKFFLRATSAVATVTPAETAPARSTPGCEARARPRAEGCSTVLAGLTWL